MLSDLQMELGVGSRLFILFLLGLQPRRAERSRKNTYQERKNPHLLGEIREG